MNLKEFSTKQLVEELKSREGVERLIAEPYEEYALGVGVKKVEGTGPAILLIVTD